MWPRGVVCDYLFGKQIMYLTMYLAKLTFRKKEGGKFLETPLKMPLFYITSMELDSLTQLYDYLGYKIRVIIIYTVQCALIWCILHVQSSAMSVLEECGSR